MGPDGLRDPGAAGDLADDPGGAVTVRPVAVGVQEDWSCAAIADGQVDRAGGARRERDSDDKPAGMHGGIGPQPDRWHDHPARRGARG
jgi:hypothetical protein